MAKDNKKLVRRRLAGAYLSSVISISLVLLLVGIASFLIVNAGRVSDYFKENLQVSVLLKTEVTDDDAETARADIEALPFIHSTRLVSREEGSRELKNMLGDDFLSVFETSPVPVSIDITLKADYVSPDSLSLVTAEIMKVPEVEEVSCRQSLVEALNTNLARISLILGIFILLMLFVSFVLIGNTVRINIFARRFTVHTMKLVGATRSFIRRPFMIISLVQGVAAAILAGLILAAGVIYVERNLPQFSVLFSPGTLIMVAGIIFACAVVICMTSTFFTVGKLVAMDRDDLYY